MHFSSFFSTSQPLQYNYRGSSSSSSSSDTSSTTSNNKNAIMKDSHQQQQSNKSKSTTSLKELLTSKDWMGSYQENHVDIDLKKTNPFLTTSSNAATTTTTSTSSSLPPPRDVPALKHDASTEQSTQQTTASTTSNNNNKSSSSTDWMGEYYQSLGAGSSEASAQASLKKSFPVPLLPRSRSSSLAKPLSRSSSRGTSTGVTNWGKPSSMDSFKMSVDFSAFMTPSMDAAMDQIHQEEEDTASKAASTNTNGNKHASSKDASVMILCGPSTAVKVEPVIPMDTTTTTSTDQATPAAAAAAAPPSLVDVAKIVALTEQTKAAQQRATAARPKPKKKKKARRNKEPDVKVFVDPSDTDVLLGRGGRSNHHKGNVAYRSEVGNLRDWYRTSEKNAKTDLSQLLVDWVHKEQAGRFLKLDTATDQWYIVTNIVARRKASQALREHMTREEREARKAQQQQGK